MWRFVKRIWCKILILKEWIWHRIFPIQLRNKFTLLIYPPIGKLFLHMVGFVGSYNNNINICKTYSVDTYYGWNCWLSVYKMYFDEHKIIFNSFENCLSMWAFIPVSLCVLLQLFYAFESFQKLISVQRVVNIFYGFIHQIKFLNS